MEKGSGKMDDIMMSWDNLDPDTLTQEQYGNVMAAALDYQISVAGKSITFFELPEREHSALSAYIYKVANGIAWDEIWMTPKWRGYQVKRMVGNG